MVAFGLAALSHFLVHISHQDPSLASQKHFYVVSAQSLWNLSLFQPCGTSFVLAPVNALSTLLLSIVLTLRSNFIPLLRFLHWLPKVINEVPTSQSDIKDTSQSGTTNFSIFPSMSIMSKLNPTSNLSLWFIFPRSLTTWNSNQFPAPHFVIISKKSLSFNPSSCPHSFFSLLWNQSV